MKGVVGVVFHLLIGICWSACVRFYIHQLAKRLTIFSVNESQLICVQCFTLVTWCWDHIRVCPFFMSRLHKCSIKLKLLPGFWAVAENQAGINSHSIQNLSSVWCYQKPSESVKIANTPDVQSNAEDGTIFTFSAQIIIKPHMKLPRHTHSLARERECEYYRTIIIKYRDEAHFHAYAVSAIVFISRGGWKCEITHENAQLVAGFVWWEIQHDALNKSKRFVESSEMNIISLPFFSLHFSVICSLVILVAESEIEFNALNNTHFNVFYFLLFSHWMRNVGQVQTKCNAFTSSLNAFSSDAAF